MPRCKDNRTEPKACVTRIRLCGRKFRNELGRWPARHIRFAKPCDTAQNCHVLITTNTSRKDVVTQAAQTLAVRRIDHCFYFPPPDYCTFAAAAGTWHPRECKAGSPGISGVCRIPAVASHSSTRRGRTFHCSSTANYRSHDHLGSSGPLGSGRLAAGEKCEMLRANGDRANDDA